LSTNPGNSARANIARQRRFWNHQADAWDENAGVNAALARVVDAVIDASEPTTTMDAIDLGCGSGQLTLKLAPRVASVLGIDVSQRMIDLLERNATASGIANVAGRAVPIEELHIDDESIDLIVTNYTLHHLRDEDKAALVTASYRWLRPGGRFVIGDMMFGRGADERDRAIIRSKLLLFAKKGPGGWWRIAKNAGRFLFRMQERPISIDAWTSMLTSSGFSEITATPVVNEAAIVVARRPETSLTP
jgi:ubiquinone/menaquinone biosynthesis C-methylase UbiE